jgi:hypothetical protein
MLLLRAFSKAKINKYWGFLKTLLMMKISKKNAIRQKMFYTFASILNQLNA